jgi:hypothetical protein
MGARARCTVSSHWAAGSGGNRIDSVLSVKENYILIYN